jgi:hypothetical protein
MLSRSLFVYINVIPILICVYKCYPDCIIYLLPTKLRPHEWVHVQFWLPTNTNPLILNWFHSIPSLYMNAFILLKFLVVLSCRIYTGWWNFIFGGYVFSLSFSKLTQACSTDSQLCLDFQLFRPEYHWVNFNSRNAHLVHQNCYRFSFTLLSIQQIKRYILSCNSGSRYAHKILFSAKGPLVRIRVE